MTRAAAATTTAGAGRRRGGSSTAAAAAGDGGDEEMADARASDDSDDDDSDSEGALFDDDDDEGDSDSDGEGDEAGFAFDDDDDFDEDDDDFDDDFDDYDDDDEDGMMENGVAGYRAAGGGRSRGGGGPSSGGGTASRSYAAAASAARPRLRFRVDGVAVPSDATVFQALNAAAAAREEAAEGGAAGGEGGVGGASGSSASGGVSARRRLWQDVHTITYELFDNDAGEAEGAEGEGGEGAMAVDNDDNDAAAANAPAATMANAMSSSNPTAVAAAASRWARADPALPPELVFAAAAAKNGLVVASSTAAAGTTTAAAASASSDSNSLLPSRAAFFRLSDDGADVLAVLKALHALNAARPRLAAAAALREGRAPPADLPRPPLRPADFVNPRLAPRLALQLKDVLAVAGGCLPPWVPALASGARFVFPGPLRARYVRLTCFGLPRALMHMASVNAAEAAAASGNSGGGGGGAGGGGGGGAGGGGDGSDSAADDARVARVARQRVRVDRGHVLDAAAKVLASHAGGRPLLEFEFAGEPGVGLGPTLEFYTMVAGELQRPGLGMWRGDAAAPSAGGKPSSRGLADAASGGGGGGGGGSGATARPRSAAATGASSHPASEPAPPAPTAPASSTIDAPLGLFPAPLPLKGGGHGVDRALSRFRTLGRLAGRALRDGRLLDLRVARPFWAAVTGASLTLADLRAVDEQLARSLEALEAAAVAAEKEEAAAAAADEKNEEDGHEMKVEGGAAEDDDDDGGDDKKKKKKKKKDKNKKKKVAVLVDGCPLEDLGLTWELPGFPSFKLKGPGGSGGGARRSSEGGNGGSGGGGGRRSSSSTGGGGGKSSHSPRQGSAITDAATLRSYVAACVDATVGSGVSRAVGAFRAGFADAAGSLACLSPFGAAEVDELICGEGVGGGSEENEHWSRAALAAAVRFDHGYTAASPSAQAFLDALASLEPRDRRAFVSWATGCPRLPPGGLAALTPRLTVVRKPPTASTSAAGTGAAAGAGAGGGGEAVAGSLGGAVLMTTAAGKSPSDAGGNSNVASSSAPAFPGAFATPADADLPSVMTCANYVKLPPYSSAAAARARLLVAIREGGGSFDLS